MRIYCKLRKISKQIRFISISVQSERLSGVMLRIYDVTAAILVYQDNAICKWRPGGGGWLTDRAAENERE